MKRLMKWREAVQIDAARRRRLDKEGEKHSDGEDGDEDDDDDVEKQKCNNKEYQLVGYSSPGNNRSPAGGGASQPGSVSASPSPRMNNNHYSTNNSHQQLSAQMPPLTRKSCPQPPLHGKYLIICFFDVHMFLMFLQGNNFFIL